MTPAGAPVADDVRALDGATVCVVGINFAPESTGIAPYTTALARAVHAAGATVRVVTGIPHYPQWAVTDPRYTRGRLWRESFEGVPVVRVTHHVPRTADLVGRAKMESSFLRSVVPVLRRTPADAVVAVTPSLAAPVAAALARGSRRLGVVVQDLTAAGAQESGTAGRAASALVGAAERWSLRRADLVGVIAPRFGERLVADGVEPARIVELANFTHIVPSALTTVDARRALGWPIDGVVALHTGNMGMKQGLENVVAAARLAADQARTDLRFVLLGDGNQRPRLEELARGVSTMQVLDPVDDERYPIALAAADVLLLNERAGVRDMSLPSKLTSYVAARRPIVAAVEAGGISHTLLTAHGAAEIVSAGEPAQLLKAVDGVAGSPGWAAALVDAGTRLGTALWSADAAADRYRAFAARLVSAR